MPRIAPAEVMLPVSAATTKISVARSRLISCSTDFDICATGFAGCTSSGPLANIDKVLPVYAPALAERPRSLHRRYHEIRANCVRLGPALGHSLQMRVEPYPLRPVHAMIAEQ